MRYFCTADWHIRATNPAKRIDNYWQTQYNKIEWILKRCRDYMVPTLLVAGDIFDSPNTPRWLVNKYIELFCKYSINIIACYGQHDLFFHNPNLENTPLGTLYAAGIFKNKLVNGSTPGGGIDTEGWKTAIGAPYKENNVLVLHETVVPKMIHFLPDALTPEALVKKYINKWIVTGDYHVFHTYQKSGRTVINCGSLMRSNKDQYNYQPQIHLLDTSNNTIESIPVPIEKPEAVFNLNAIEVETNKKEVDERVIEFVEAIGVKSNKPKFKDILNDVVGDYNPSVEVMNVISDVITEVEETL